MNPVNPTITIVGITGDLAEKKLLPSLYGLAERGLLADDTKIVGTSRRPITNEAILAKLNKPEGDKTLAWIASHLSTLEADPGTEDGAATLAKFLEGDNHTRLFYLSIPPTTFENVISSMAKAGLNTDHDSIMVEKPFGDSGASAMQLHKLTQQYYKETNIYRVDHYLAKPGVRSISDSGAEVLDPRRILAIDVRSNEALDIQGRADFYEQSGALRDILQSHLLQVLAVCLTAHKAHAEGQLHVDAKADALADLEVLGAYRAQYDGYKDEVNNPNSTVETYAALELTSSNHEWRDVRITVRSGKALSSKESDITVTFDDHTTHTFDMNDNPAHILDGYEQVLYDGARSHRALFLSERDVNESWRIVDPTLESWAGNSAGLDTYKKGTAPAATI